MVSGLGKGLFCWVTRLGVFWGQIRAPETNIVDTNISIFSIGQRYLTTICIFHINVWTNPFHAIAYDTMHLCDRLPINSFVRQVRSLGTTVTKKIWKRKTYSQNYHLIIVILLYYFISGMHQFLRTQDNPKPFLKKQR